MYRRQHEKALCKVIDRIADMIIAKELDLESQIDLCGDDSA
jgi:hypothetical protein